MITLIIELIKYKLIRLFSKKGSFREMAAFEFECKAEKAIKNKIHK